MAEKKSLLEALKKGNKDCLNGSVGISLLWGDGYIWCKNYDEKCADIENCSNKEHGNE